MKIRFYRGSAHRPAACLVRQHRRARFVRYGASEKTTLQPARGATLFGAFCRRGLTRSKTCPAEHCPPSHAPPTRSLRIRAHEGSCLPKSQPPWPHARPNPRHVWQRPAQARDAPGRPRKTRLPTRSISQRVMSNRGGRAEVMGEVWRLRGVFATLCA